MSKHFKNQASKRRRDGFQHRSKSCMKRLVSQLFQQSEDYARLKIDNSLLYGKVVKLNQLLMDERKSALREIQKTEAIHDGIVKTFGDKLNQVTRSRNTYRFLFWSLVAAHIVAIAVEIAARFIKH